MPCRTSERAAGQREGEEEDARRPRTCWRTRSALRPRTPKVSRRLAAVLPTAVIASASGVRGARAEQRRAAGEEQDDVRERAEHADGDERRDRAMRPSSRATPLRSSTAVRTRSHARVGVVDPVDRHLVDPQPAALGEHEQLGVEEPAVVADLGEQVVEHVAADGLEAALGVGEARPQHGVQDAVVGARDELALRRRARRASRARAVSRSPGRSGPTAAARRAAAARAGPSRGRRPCSRRPAPRLARPGLAQRAAAALPLELQVLDAGQLAAQPPRRSRRGVRAARCRPSTIRHENGNSADRKRCRRRRLSSSAAASLWTGTTMSICAAGAVTGLA